MALISSVMNLHGPFLGLAGEFSLPGVAGLGVDSCTGFLRTTTLLWGSRRDLWPGELTGAGWAGGVW